MKKKVKCACGKMVNIADVPVKKIQMLTEAAVDMLCINVNWEKGIRAITVLQVYALKNNKDEHPS